MALTRLHRLQRNAPLFAVSCAILGWLQVSAGFNALYLTRVRHLTLIDAGLVISAWGLAGTAGQVVLPFASDYLGRRLVTFVGAVVCALTLLAYLVGGGPALTGLLVMLALSGFFGWGTLPIALATCSRWRSEGQTSTNCTPIHRAIHARKSSGATSGSM